MLGNILVIMAILPVLCALFYIVYCFSRNVIENRFFSLLTTLILFFSIFTVPLLIIKSKFYHTIIGDLIFRAYALFITAFAVYGWIKYIINLQKFKKEYQNKTPNLISPPGVSIYKNNPRTRLIIILLLIYFSTLLLFSIVYLIKEIL